MRRYRVGVYLEVEAPGTDADDAASRAAGTIAARVHRTAARVNADSGEFLEGEDGEVYVHAASSVDAAFRSGFLRVTPRREINEQPAAL